MAVVLQPPYVDATSVGGEKEWSKWGGMTGSAERPMLAVVVRDVGQDVLHVVEGAVKLVEGVEGVNVMIASTQRKCCCNRTKRSDRIKRNDRDRHVAWQKGVGSGA